MTKKKMKEAEPEVASVDDDSSCSFFFLQELKRKRIEEEAELLLSSQRRRRILLPRQGQGLLRPCPCVLTTTTVLVVMAALLLSSSCYCNSSRMTCCVAAAADAQEEESFNPKAWYQRYPVYPPYCSTPQEMSKRSIPPLQTRIIDQQEREQQQVSLKLVQVTVLLRHGARTPCSAMVMNDCWDNYTQQDTGVWNCQLTTLMAPPSPKRILEQEQETTTSNNGGGAAGQSFFLFEKQYNALNDVQHNLSNELPGTCQLGQLLLRGYEQELATGQHLRQAYFGNETADPRMQLFNTSTTSSSSRPWMDLYYRADDDQRTLMSGQVLLRGLLEKELQQYYYEYHQLNLNNNYTSNGNIPAPVILLPLHTADRARDILSGNEGICPRLTEIHEQFRSSPEYQIYRNSHEAQTLERFLKNVLFSSSSKQEQAVVGGGSGDEKDDDAEVEKNDTSVIDSWGGVDCLMTTICTDRTLPEAINDYRGPIIDTTDSNDSSSSPHYGTNLFDRLFRYSSQSGAVQLFRYQDAVYSKLAMTPLWKDILANIQGMMETTKTKKSVTVCCPPRPPPKLALYSGHDSTLMPMLASLLGPDVWDGEWSPYASMLNIELYYYQQPQQHQPHQQQDTNADEEDQHNLDDNFWFRLVYNGKVLTPLVKGCKGAATNTTKATTTSKEEEANEDLCPIRVLIERVTSFTRNFNCTRSDGGAGANAGGGGGDGDNHDNAAAVSITSIGLSTPGGVLALCLLVVGSALFGSLGTYLYLTGSNKVRRGGRQRLSQLDDRRYKDDGDDDGDAISMQFHNDKMGGVGANDQDGDNNVRSPPSNGTLT